MGSFHQDLDARAKCWGKEWLTIVGELDGQVGSDRKLWGVIGRFGNMGRFNQNVKQGS